MRRVISAVLPLTVALTVCLPATPAFAVGTSYTWIGGSNSSGGDNHSWTDPKNWSPSGTPGNGDSVSIDSPAPSYCTAHVDNIPTVSLVGLSISQNPDRCGVSITGGSITVTGTFTWDGGDIATPIAVAAGADGVVSGANGRLDDLSANMDVAGSLTLDGVTGTGASNSGAMRIDNPEVLHVLVGGTLTSTGANDIRFLSCCGNPARIVNDGTIAVSGGDFTVDAVEVDQNGTLTASSGGRLVTIGAPLTAGDGAHYTGTGSWLIEDGAKAKMSGTQALGSNFHLELGPLNMNAGAQLGGTATFAGSGTVDWTGGTIEGNLTIAHGVTVLAAGAHTDNGKRALTGQDGLSNNAASVVTNHGTIRLDQGAGVLTAANAQLVNASDGVLSLAPGTQFSTAGCCVNPTRVVNHGTVTVPSGSAGTPAVLDGVAYRSDATTSVAANHELQLDEAPGSLSSATVIGGGTLAVAAPMAVSGTITVARGTKLELRTGGSLNGTATIGGAGSLHWTGGSVSGHITVSASGGNSDHRRRPEVRGHPPRRFHADVEVEDDGRSGNECQARRRQRGPVAAHSCVHHVLGELRRDLRRNGREHGRAHRQRRDSRAQRLRTAHQPRFPHCSQWHVHGRWDVHPGRGRDHRGGPRSPRPFVRLAFPHRQRWGAAGCRDGRGGRSEQWRHDQARRFGYRDAAHQRRLHAGEEGHARGRPRCEVSRPAFSGGTRHNGRQAGRARCGQLRAAVRREVPDAQRLERVRIDVVRSHVRWRQRWRALGDERVC